MKLEIIIIGILSIIVCCFAYKSGAPNTACSTLKPKHKDYKEQIINSPFKIEAKKAKKVIEVTISGTEKFKGFLLVARNDTNNIIGKWDPTEKAKLIKCDNENDAITHKSNVEKSSMKLKWNTPDKFKGNVHFQGTVVKNGKTFWIGIKSNSILL